MLKRPHTIGNRTVFIKRSLPRAMASIPERVIVTNRLLIINPKRFRRSKLRSYFGNFGKILKFDYENGILDFDVEKKRKIISLFDLCHFQDYDSIDRILLARPNLIENQEIKLTKFDFNEKQNREIDDEISSVNSISSRLVCRKKKLKFRRLFSNKKEKILFKFQASIHVDQDIRTKYENLEKEFFNYKLIKEKELNEIRFELKRVKEDLEEITQMKLDKLLKNQQTIHRDLLSFMVDQQIKSNSKISEQFYPSNSNKKRRNETNIFY